MYPKTLRILFGLLCLLELGCLVGASPGSRPNSQRVRQEVVRWKQNPTAENSASLHAAMDDAENRFGRIRRYSLAGLLVNTVALILTYRLMKNAATGGAG
jgi:hypothetical protein